MRQRRITHDNFEVAVIWADRLVFAPHSHDEYVLSCNISGNESLVLDGKAMAAAETATTLYNPGQVQSGDGTDCLVSIYLDPDYFEKEMLSSRSVDFDRPIVSDEPLLESFNDLLNLGMRRGSPQAAEELVLQIIDLTIERYTAISSGEPPQADDWRVEKVKEILLDRLHERIPMAEVASAVDLNKIALTRMFTNATGLPPGRWQRTKRMEAARRMLKEGLPAAETAYRTGFSDQAHLTRWFGRAYGISPVQFAKKK